MHLDTYSPIHSRTFLLGIMFFCLQGLEPGREVYPHRQDSQDNRVSRTSRVEYRF